MPPVARLNRLLSGKFLLPIIAATTLALTGCGGGGGSGGSSSTSLVAKSSAVTTVEDTPVSDTLVATNTSGKTLTYSIVSNGSIGTATLTNPSTGAFTYTPNQNANGSDAFTYKASDGSSSSNSATVTVDITPLDDDPPVAQSGTLTTPEDIVINATLAANDPDGNTLVYRIATNGSKGMAVITDTATGAFTYTPNSNANGSDIFTFIVNDSTTDSNEAFMAIEISPVNDVPVAFADNLNINQDIAGDGTLVATDADSINLVYEIVTAGDRGTAVITDAATGAFTYTPNAGESGTDAFTFRISDGSANSNIAAIAVNINIQPVTTGSCATTPQAQTLTGTLTATDTETPGLLMFNLFVDGSGGAGPITTAKGGTVTLTDQTTGAFQYQPALSGESRGTDTFAYQVSDPDGGTDSAVETVIVDIKIMPFGDSITSGMVDGANLLPIKSDRVGYRKPLFDTMTTNGFAFDFTGSRILGENLLSDPETESFGGYSALQLAYGLTGYPVDGIRAWLTDNPADIVLVHAGTNDGPNPNGQDDIAAILDEIDLWENSPGGNPVTVLLALIIDQNPIDPNVVTFNNNVAAMAAARTTDDIRIVDQHGALNYPADMGDQLHPNPTGYSKMSGAWFNTLQTIVDKCP